MDHNAIYKAYPDCKRIDGSLAFRADGTQITLVQSEIDAARATLDADYAKVKYKDDRQPLYPPLEVSSLPAPIKLVPISKTPDRLNAIKKNT